MRKPLITACTAYEKGTSSFSFAGVQLPSMGMPIRLNIIVPVKTTNLLLHAGIEYQIHSRPRSRAASTGRLKPDQHPITSFLCLLTALSRTKGQGAQEDHLSIVILAKLAQLPKS